MTQSELNRAVAKATGETLKTVRHLGFSLVDPDVAQDDPERYGLETKVVDRAVLGAQGIGALRQQQPVMA